MKIINMDAIIGLQQIQSDTIDCCITSPPYYGLRDYGCEGQIGLEQTPDEYINRLVDVFREVRRALKPNGTLWIVIGDSYAGSGKGAATYPESVKNSKQGTNKGMVGAALPRTARTPELKNKDLIGVPWMLAFALRADGWFLRQDIIWHKPNPMPESVRDRCTKAHEYIFLMSKSPRYYFDAEAIAEPVAETTTKRVSRNKLPVYGGNKYTETPDEFYRTKSGEEYNYKPMRNKRDVWTVSTRGYKGAHFATFPETLVETCVLAGCPEGGIVLDPFMGSGTTGLVALRNGRDFCGIDINDEYCRMANNRINGESA